MTLLKIKRNYVLVEIKSTVFETELYVLEESKFDIIKDGYYDISVLLNSISSGRASITITTVSLTTAERDALTGVTAGAMIFNETTSKLNFYTGSAWEVITSA